MPGSCTQSPGALAICFSCPEARSVAENGLSASVQVRNAALGQMTGQTELIHFRGHNGQEQNLKCYEILLPIRFRCMMLAIQRKKRPEGLLIGRFISPEGNRE